MGIFASFLDLLWPSRKADPAPQPLPKLVLTDLLEQETALRQRALAAEVERYVEFAPPSEWKPWPPLQFDAASEARLKKLASSRTREPVQVKPWSKPVRTPLGEFGSVSEAAEAHGIARSTLHEYLAKGVEGWERLPKPAVTVKGTRKAKRAVMCGTAAFVSVSAAARFMGRSTQTIHRWCKAGVRGWRYAD